MPPAFVDSMPPICAVPWAPHWMGKRRPASAAACWMFWTTHPASATREKSRASMDRMRLRRSSDSTMDGGPLAAGTVPPQRPVRPPAGTIERPSETAHRTTPATSAVVAGFTTATGVP